MRRTFLLPMLVVAGLAAAEEQEDELVAQSLDTAAPPSAQEDADTRNQASAGQAGGVKTLSGMSILGNEEAPKSLVIVPWKSSQIGDGLGVANAMDDRARPVDKEVFMREVHYYELRSGTEN